jgi:lysophospholipase L1-like esterase
MPFSPAPSVRIPGDLTRGNRFGFLGDSITIVDTAPNAMLTEYHVHLAHLSGGRIEWGKKAGLAGATTAQVLATHLPALLAYPIRPDRVIVLAGTNDCTTATVATAAANLAAIYRALRAAGIEPIAATLTPRIGFTTPQRAVYDGICRFVARHAGENGYPLIDFASAMTADDGNWLDPAWTADNVHPTIAGARKMADVAWAALQPTLVPSSALLPASNADITGLANPLFLTDANADGIPDGWSLNSGPGGTKALVDATTDAAGNWFEISKNTTGVVDYTSAILPAAPGDRIRAGARFMVSGVTGSASLIIEAKIQGATGGARLASSWNANVPAGTLMTEFICPAGTTGVRLAYSVNPSAGGAITARLAQPLLINLTAAGIA